jgi:hypothetical protein
MDEQALYNNLNEPPFPFEAVCSHLSWLPAFLSQKIVFLPEDLEPFLNTNYTRFWKSTNCNITEAALVERHECFGKTAQLYIERS